MKQAAGVHIEIPLALAPIPADPDGREFVEAKIVAAAKLAMNGAPLMKGPLQNRLIDDLSAGCRAEEGP
jgi:hypothetical protein